MIARAEARGSVGSGVFVVAAKSLSEQVGHGFVTCRFHRLKTGATKDNEIGSKIVLLFRQA